MNVDAFSLALGMLTIAAAGMGIAALAGRLLRIDALAVTPSLALTASAGIAVVAMLGSLTYSEYFHFTPCELCWYQRIAMYPLALLLGIAAWREDLDIRRYAIPLASIGAAISAWHVLVQRVPSIEGGSCDVTAPCTVIWVDTFNVFTIPTMALVGFLSIIALLATTRSDDA